MNIKSGFSMLKEAFQEWQKDEALQLGAALAYYTIFSIAPMLLVAIAVAGFVWGREAVQGELVAQIQGLVGKQGAEAVQTMIANAGRQESSSIWATVIALATILFGATGAFVQLQTSLNHIWNVEARTDSGVKGLVKARVVAFGMVLAIGFLLLVSLVVSTAVSALGNYLGGRMPGAQTLIAVVSFVVLFALITALFALMFKFLPDVRIEWRDVWVGAVVTALLFSIGKFLIGLYLGNSSVASTYGAAGSLIILLLWIYYSTQILFFGAELTQVYSRRYGSGIVPNNHAVPVETVKVHTDQPEQGVDRRSGKDRRKGRMKAGDLHTRPHAR